MYADWGRAGGQGGSAYLGKSYNPNVADACPKHTGSPFYISITPAAGVVDGSGPYDKKPNDQCVVRACNNLGGGDARENCEGAMHALNLHVRTTLSASSHMQIVLRASMQVLIDVRVCCLNPCHEARLHLRTVWRPIIIGCSACGDTSFCCTGHFSRAHTPYVHGMCRQWA